MYDLMYSGLLDRLVIGVPFRYAIFMLWGKIFFLVLNKKNNVLITQ